MGMVGSMAGSIRWGYHSGRTRPLCEWPAWPKYGGVGDVKRASSFTCVTPAGGLLQAAVE
jgi:hypothetical protein